MRYPLKQQGYPHNVFGAIDHQMKMPRYSDAEFLAAVKYHVAKMKIYNEFARTVHMKLWMARGGGGRAGLHPRREEEVRGAVHEL